MKDMWRKEHVREEERDITYPWWVHRFRGKNPREPCRGAENLR